VAEIKTVSDLEMAIYQWENWGRQLHAATRNLSRGRSVELPDMPTSLTPTDGQSTSAPPTTPSTSQPTLDFERLAEEVYQCLKARFPVVPENQVNEQVLEEKILSSEKLTQRIRELIEELDVEDLADKILDGWQESDNEAMHDRLAELLKERVIGELDKKALSRELAERLLDQDDNSLDLDEVQRGVVEELTDRLQISISQKEED